MHQKWTRLAGHRHLARSKLLAKRQKVLRETEESVNKVINSPTTKKTFLKDYPEVEKYLSGLFPNIDLSAIPIYVARPNVMDRAGFKSAGGLHVSHMNVVLVRTDIEIKAGKRNRFERLMDREIQTSVERRDVVIHELLHAVSSRTRSGNSFSHGEEEFVYTNCVDFYKQQGQNEDEIIAGSFLPFCINDVMSDREEMAAVFAELREIEANIPDVSELTTQSYRRLMSRHAHHLVPIIVARAKNKGRAMIDLYNKYGRQSLHANTAPENSTSLRMQSIDMDDDWGDD
jgi:hypothetical protein